jgi:hypothetical protein
MRISVNAGEVTLGGLVHTLNERKIVEEVVAYQPGVEAVINRLNVEAEVEFGSAPVLPICIPVSGSQLELLGRLYEGSD